MTVEEKKEVCCWLDKESRVISFHCVVGFEEMKFESQRDMVDYCATLISMGYKVQ